ncbi:T9SS type A sorting domain-containing protein [Ilyomonas limi]|uniref:T9SS type A sorting domain-containing protein n=1 Tax=Ilyomonas limi TaxID=2575867 RepID=A0A4U3L1E2_9BACT|nr:Calx-beta domain-containing protein [Ilyomonas limi]TKK68951.1 T9SS type A sorting domain-containing protein [Ilyomonas limi]
MKKLCLLLLFYVFVFNAIGQAGSLDSSFGNNGIQTTAFPNNLNLLNEHGRVVLTSANGDIFVVIQISSSLRIAKYLPDGKLDSSYGTAGYSKAVNMSESSAAMQEDKIIVAGYTIISSNNYNNDFALARYTADGALDISFGKQGLLTGYFPSTKTNFTSTVLQGNKIMAAGSALNDSNNYDFALARFTTNGVLDSSFGVNGKVITDFNSSTDEANSMVLQGGKIIVAGSGHNYSDFALVRYTSDGAIDSSFGVNGKVTTDFNNDYAVAYSIALQEDKIIVSGSTQNPVNDNNDFALARYTADGKLDASFGKNGKVTTDFNSSEDHANTMALQGNKILVGGYSLGGSADFALARYTTDGVLDSSFGENGKVTTNFGFSSEDIAYSIALQGDKIISAGYTGYYPIYDFALARYTADGILDSSFGDNGKVITAFNSSIDDENYESATSIAIQEDKIIVAGFTGDNRGSADFALARYTTDGVLDSSFGENGKVITPLGGSATIQDIAVHQNRLYAVGSTSQPDGTYGIIAAYELEAPVPTVSIANVKVLESKKLAVVTVRLSAPASKLVWVHFTTRHKTAVRNQDYIGISGTLLFIPHLNTTAKIFIPIIDDNEHEDDERFEIVLTNARDAAIKDSIGIVTILDNDNALIAKQQSASLHINVNPNPATNTFTLQLQGSNLKQPVTVRVYDVSGRLVEQKNNIAIGQSLRFGDQYKAGTYIIEAVQGSQSVQMKVIKTGK